VTSRILSDWLNLLVEEKEDNVVCRSSSKVFFELKAELEVARRNNLFLFV
jgi:hypothetical protein